jgi:hypothetical protein
VTFGGGITLGGDSVIETGSLNVYQAANSSSATVWNGGWNAGSGRNITSSIFSDGSATFKGEVKADTRNSNSCALYGLTTSTAKGDAPLKLLNGSNAGGQGNGYLINGLGVSSKEVFNVTNEGQAEFAGQVYGSGFLADTPNNSTSIVFRGKNSDGTTTSTVLADGSASFAGTIKTDEYVWINRSSGISLLIQQDGDGSTPDNKIVLNSDGSASFTQRVDIGGTSSTATALTATNSSAAAPSIYGRNNIGQKAPVFVAADSTGNGKATIYNDGSAIFADGDFNVANDGTLSITTSFGGSGLIQLSDKIALNGADGSAEFENSSAGAYTYISNRPAATSFCISGGNVSDPGNVTWYIKPDGAATFRGNTQVGPLYDNVSLVPGNGDGSNPAVVVINGRPAADGNQALRIDRFASNGTSATTVADIKWDGSATFAGSVQSVGRVFTTGANAKLGVYTNFTGSSSVPAVEIEDLGGRKATINTDGSASFVGDLNIGNAGSATARVGISSPYNRVGLQVYGGSTDGVTNTAEFYNANAGLVASIGGDGSATFAGTAKKDTFDNDSDGGFGWRLTNGADFGQLDVQMAETVDPNVVKNAVFRVYNGQAVKTSIDGSGSATFSGYITSTRYSANAALGANVSGTNYPFVIYDASSNIYASVDQTGNGVFAGTVTANGSILTRSSGTLDVGDRLEKVDSALQALKTAAAASSDFAALKSAIATALADI